MSYCFGIEIHGKLCLLSDEEKVHLYCIVYENVFETFFNISFLQKLLSSTFLPEKVHI